MSEQQEQSAGRESNLMQSEEPEGMTHIESVPPNNTLEQDVTIDQESNEGEDSATTQKVTKTTTVAMSEPIVDTPPPVVDEEDDSSVALNDTDASIVTVAPIVSTVPAAPSLKARLAQVLPGRLWHVSQWRTVVTYALLALLISNVLLLWHDMITTHLFVSTLDFNNGKILAQQDLGAYQDHVALTEPMIAPAAFHSSVLLGVHSDDPEGTQQVLTFTGSNTSWSVAEQLSAPLVHGAISVTSNGHVLVESTSGMQVYTADGHLLWQLQSEQPARGIHHFQPVSDASTVYTVKSVKQAQIAAYNLQNGKAHWTQTLDDTLDYAPPLVLDDGTLYVASDHKVYALNSSDGSLRWEKTYVARTLLKENEGQIHLLLTVGAQGVHALQVDTGAVAWTFQGESSNTQSSTQLYQAALGNPSSPSGNSIYTTGIVWQMPQVKEQVWLYAINASTGTLLWSRPVASGLISADAGRASQPLLDTTHRIVALQRQTAKDDQFVTAFDASTGAQRWNTHITKRTASSPTLLRTTNNTFVLFMTLTDSTTVFWTASIARTLMRIFSALSIVGLLFLWLLPFRQGIGRLQRISSASRRYACLILQQPFRLWHFSRRLSASILLVVLIAASLLTYTQLSQSQERVYQIATHTAAVQWQHVPTTPTQPLAIDAQGSIVVSTVGDNTHQLEALNPDGTTSWRTLSSEGTFSISTTVARPGTILVELSGHTLLNYQFAPDDPAYTHPLDHMLALYLLDRKTGQPLWQHIVVYPDEQQDAMVLGSDADYIYIASTQLTSTAEQDNIGRTVQLFAVNQITGTTDWRVFGPSESENAPHDDGRLLLRNGQAIWQVAGVVYAIDTGVGQIEWRR